jgi:SAM-dependent methyltransferase
LYKEWRSVSDPADVWADVFLGRSRFRNALSIFRLRIDTRWRTLRPLLKADARVLEAGCGLGQWVIYLSRQGFNALGLDFSPRLISEVRSNHSEVPWLAGTIQHMPLATGSLDAVISWGVIEHDEEGPGAALQEFARVLRPGGIAVVTVPRDSRAMRNASSAQFPGDEDDQMFFQYLFTEAELAGALERAGLTVERIMTAGRHFAPVLPRLSAWLVHRRSFWTSVATQVLKPYAWLHPESPGMLLAIGRAHIECNGADLA